MAINDDEVVKSVERVFAMLEWFEREQVAVGATTLARALDYPLSSTIAILKSMSALGHLTFDPIGRTYFPTLRVGRSNSWLERSWPCGHRVRDLAAEVAHATGEMVTLSCQNDLQMLYVRIEEGTRPLDVVMAAGDPAPLFRSAIGLTALSGRRDREVMKLLTSYNRRTRQPTAKADPHRVMGQLRAIRSAGYGVGYDLYMPDIGAIAWPLPMGSGPHGMVMAVGGPSRRLREGERDIVGKTRLLIGRYLGATALMRAFTA